MNGRLGVRAVVLVTLLTLLGGCGGQVPPASPGAPGTADGSPAVGSAPPNGSAPSAAPAGSGPVLPPPGPVLDPAAAATAVLQASDDDARVAAILGILDGVNLGVYTSDGQPIVVGAERSEADVWAYDFEVAGLAAGVRDGDVLELGSIANDLVEMAATDGGSVQASAVTAAVHEAAAAVVADPDRPDAYALAVAVELARQGTPRVDLAVPSGDPVLLDPLAAFLVTLDLVLPHVAARPPSGTVHDGRVASTDGARLAAAPCPQVLSGSGRWIAGISAGATGLGGISNASYDRYLQGRLVGGTVAMDLEGHDTWHHGHEDANGGSDATDKLYQLTLAVRVPGPSGPIPCGSLSGTSMPPMGMVVGADVTWRHPGLEEHSTIVTDPRTSDRGLAFLVATPKTEPYPSAIGPEERRTIDIEAEVNVLQALGGDLYMRLAGVPALQTERVHTQVAWHRTYVVELVIDSELTMIKGNSYPGTLGKTRAQGHFPVVDYITATQAPPPPGFASELNVVSLTTTTTPAATKGKCDTEWIVPGRGPSRSIDWTIVHLVVYPETDIQLRMDAGPYSEDFPDDYDGLMCPPSGRIRLGPSRGSVWETLIFLEYQQGVQLKGIGQGRWTIVGTRDTWRTGGEIAIWESQPTCQGYCSGTLKVTLRVQPLPGP